MSVLLSNTVCLDGFSKLLTVSIALGESMGMSFLGIRIWFLSSRAIHGDILTESFTANDVVAISESICGSFLDIRVWLLCGWAIHGYIFSKSFSSYDVIAISESVT